MNCFGWVVALLPWCPGPGRVVVHGLRSWWVASEGCHRADGVAHPAGTAAAVL